MKPYWVYSLWSDRAHVFYIGVAEDVDSRLNQHNAGESKWTSRYAGSWALVWTRCFPSLREARQFERKLKKQKKGRGFWSLTNLHPDDFPGPSGP